MPLFENKEVVNFPDITGISFKKIEKRYLKMLILSRTSYFIIESIFFIGFAEWILAKKNPEYTLFLYIALFLLFMASFVITILEFSKRKYTIREEDIIYKSRLITETMVTIPFSRIQHIEIKEGVFPRLFKLTAIYFFTASDSSTDLEIRGITKDKALKIKEFISQKINE